MKNESPVIRVQTCGRCAEVVVDTGHPLQSGKNWLAFAKVQCANGYTARMVCDSLARRIESAVIDARREAYYLGYEAARHGQPARPRFDGVL